MLSAAFLFVGVPSEAPVASSSSTALAKTLPAANLCSSEEHHQFDFWVGQWDVYRADKPVLVAHSLIEKIYNGCAVRESWIPLQGAGGGSLNTYRPATKEWRQTWTDSANDLNEYSGTWNGQKMVLTGTMVNAAGIKTPVRMTYEKGHDGSVVQTGYQSNDGGHNWKLSYKFVYRRSSAGT